jgi:hypothetical protein
MNAYEFIVRMRDYATSGLQRVAQTAGVANRQIDQTDQNIRKTEKSTNILSSSMSKLKNIIVGVFAVAAVWNFTNKVIEARAEYEKFSAVLTNTFQSEAVGQGALNMLTKFAAETPYALNELTGAFVKLVNRGFNPTKDQLKEMGDLAASQGKGFDQLTEAILDAESGEFERLKEFGIKASKAGDQVSFSFKGVTKTVQANADAMRQAVLEYGNMTGVAGSMEAVSKTLGGKISNLGDQWDGFLVKIGGQSSGVFTGVLEMVGNAMDFLSAHLEDISTWFGILWSYITPVVDSLGHFIDIALGFDSASQALGFFQGVMNSVLVVVGIFSTGLTTVIDLLAPFADYIATAAVAYGLWNGVLAIHNALMLANPTTWIIISIIALIMVIGMVMKYTSGWGESWKHTVNGAKLLWQSYTDYVRANFNTLIQGLMIGINKIKEGWYSFKEAVGMGNSDENKKMLAQIAADTEARKKSISDGYKKMAENGKAALSEFKQVGITVDTAGIKKDFANLQSKFGGGTPKDTSTAAYDNFIAKNTKEKGKQNNGTDKAKADGIVSGGAKITHITINIDKLQDDTKIYVGSTDKGIDQLGEKVQEMLLRAVNSVNQMQTG